VTKVSNVPKDPEDPEDPKDAKDPEDIPLISYIIWRGDDGEINRERKGI
jgi:hypothetical protein